MIIREIQESDVKQFIELNKALAKETSFLLPTADECSLDEEKQLKKIQKMLEHKMQMVFIAEIDGKLVGFIGITRFGLSKVKHIATFAIGVLDTYKGNGVASKLLGAMGRFTLNHNLSRVEFTVMENNPRAISFYKKHGYKQEGLKENAIYQNGKFYNEIYMAKLI